MNAASSDALIDRSNSCRNKSIAASSRRQRRSCPRSSWAYAHAVTVKTRQSLPCRWFKRGDCCWRWYWYAFCMHEYRNDRAVRAIVLRSCVPFINQRTSTHHHHNGQQATSRRSHLTERHSSTQATTPKLRPIGTSSHQPAKHGQGMSGESHDRGSIVDSLDAWRASCVWVDW